MNDCCGSSPVTFALMADKLLETTPLVSGAAILLAFFAGYKYAQRSQTVREIPAENKELRGDVALGSGEAPMVSLILPAASFLRFTYLIYRVSLTSVNIRWS